MSNILYNYRDYINDIKKFRTVDREGMGRFDTPSAMYFKVFFYFNENHGLLGTEGMDFTKQDIANDFVEKINQLDSETVKSTTIHDTAFTYLLLNSEQHRAKLLKQFVQLLSNISTNSPWYFSKVTGVDAAIERKMFEKEFKIEEERKKISIECLPDAYDNRIGTLLDLYKAVCYSYEMKREVLPANLRKFNMGILLFNAPISSVSDNNTAKATIPNNGSENVYIENTKLIEFRNCEIDINSSKSAYSDINQENPLEQKYTIDISFDDAYESRYNELLQLVIGDFIAKDIDVLASDDNSYGKKFPEKSDNLLNNLTDTAMTMSESTALSAVKKLYLGNINGYGVGSAVNQAKNIIEGDPTSVAIGAAAKAVNSAIAGERTTPQSSLGKYLPKWEYKAIKNRAQSALNNLI